MQLVDLQLVEVEFRHRRMGQVEKQGVVVVSDLEGVGWPADRKLGQPADWVVQSAEGLGELADMQLEEGKLAEKQLKFKVGDNGDPKDVEGGDDGGGNNGNPSAFKANSQKGVAGKGDTIWKFKKCAFGLKESPTMRYEKG